MRALPLIALLLVPAFLACRPGPCGRIKDCCEAFVDTSPGAYTSPKGMDLLSSKINQGLGSARLKGVQDRCVARREGQLTTVECRELERDLLSTHLAMNEPFGATCATQEPP